ncbi:LPXTG cell wall anchor domain-containing protein [Aerococcaceae bacterium NML180378]|nr:LPXTG cell wall anchor domain-containing protein [Aerococcaceae bacterium NML180378]
MLCRNRKRRIAQMLLGLSTVTLVSIMAHYPSVFAEETLAPPVEEVQVEQPVSEGDHPEAEMPTNEEVAKSEEHPEKAEIMQPIAEVNAEASVLAEVNMSPVQLEDKTVYMSEEAMLSDTITSNQDPTTYTWTLDGKPLAEWKIFDMTSGDLTGDPFITFTSNLNSDGTYTLDTNVKALFGPDLSKRSPMIRRRYRHYMKEYELKGVSSDGTTTLTRKLNLRPYESFQTHDELLADIEHSKTNAAANRLVDIETIGKSAENRDIKMGIIAKNQAVIDRYLQEFSPVMLTQPDELLKLLENNQLDYQLPILINNTHADEQPGIDIISGLFKEFATKDIIKYQTTDENDQPKEVTLNVPQLLEKFILLFNFTENPDGNVNNTRTLLNGIDPNRDAGYQANPETRATVAQINKWNPIALLDIHGFVEEFLIEPATPPHDPNFEYDLLTNLMVEHAKEMGRAGVANSKYTSYLIPKLDWADGWDDSFSGYTGVYAVYHGILGHTVEIPESNQESYKAGYFASLASVNFLTTRPDELMKMRLQFYSRGINKVEHPDAEKELVGPDGKVVGRVKGNNPKFFPDYYVIPMTLDKFNDMEQAFNMIEYFKRNGVIVKELLEDVGMHKKGDLVIDMAQAKRGYANHVLYPGSNESQWSAMYAELVMNFPAMRGFKSTPVFADKLFDGKLGEVTHGQAPRSASTQVAPYYIVANTSVAAVRAVNQAIANGAKVYLTDDGYVMDAATFNHLLPQYPLYGEALHKRPVGMPLKALNIYSPAHRYSWSGDFPIIANVTNALKEMGFNLVDTPEQADVIVLESVEFDASILGKKPTIVLGGRAMQKLEKLGVLAGFDATHNNRGSNYEGLFKAVINDLHPLTSGYLANGLFYSNSGNWIDGVPAGFEPLVRIANQDYYIAGWWPGNENMGDKVMAINGQYGNQPMFIYAGNPTNKLHSLHFYRWVTNAIYGSDLVALEEIETPTPPTTEQPKPQPETPKEMPTGKVATLPNTGEVSVPPFVISTIFILVGGMLIQLKRKEEM